MFSSPELHPELAPLLLAAVGNSVDVIMITDAQSVSSADGPRIVYVNPAFEKLTGYSAAEVIGKNPRMLQGPKTDRAALARIRTALESGQPIREELLNYRKDGSEYYIDLSIVPAGTEKGHFSHFISIQRETTQQHLLREQMEQVADLPFAFSSAQMRVALESAKVGLWFYYPASDTKFYSTEMKRLFDIPLETPVLSYQSFLQRLHPDDVRAVDQANQIALRDLREYSKQYRVLHSDGSTHWISANGRAFFDSEQQCVVYVGTASEITEHKQIEHDLLEAQRIARIGTWQWDRLTNTVEWSEATYRNFGLTPGTPVPPYEELVKMYTPESGAALDAAVRHCLETGEPYSLDLEIPQPDGNTTWIAARGEVQSWLDGKPSHLRGTVQDITERKRFEIAIRQSDERMLLGIQVADLTLAEIDYSTGINHLSAAAARVFGLGESDMAVPRGLVHATFHPDDRAELDRRIAICLDPAGPGWFAMDHRVVWPSGDVRWLRVRKQVYFSGEGAARKPCRAILAAFDVTSEKSVELALMHSEKLASVGRMASTIAHEINNPLATIGQAVFLAMTDPGIPAEAREHLELATRELERAALITRQTLAFSRDSSSPRRTDLREVAESVTRLFSPRAAARGVVLVERYRETGWIEAFASELRQVLFNLLSNSLDAVPSRGSIVVRVARGRMRGGVEAVRLVVADNGSGISPEQLHKIFEPFFTTKDIVGTGLGLWVVSQIVEKHRARIKVRSKVDRGTVFTLFFPAMGPDPSK